MKPILNNRIFAADSASLADLFSRLRGYAPKSITAIAASGSNRRYYRVDDLIGTFGEDIPENRAFIYLSGVFTDAGLNVPKVLEVSNDMHYYLQSDGGERSLFECIASGRSSGAFSEHEIQLMEDAIRLLARVQTRGGARVDWRRCYPRQSMDTRMVRWDLNYFKYCFLKPSGVVFNEDTFQEELDRLEVYLLRNESRWHTFMVRDFQSRNLMVDDRNHLTMIDFQGGRRGPRHYDVASFLWQAKARIPTSLKEHLIDIFTDETAALDPQFSKEEFRRELPTFVLFRIMQTLGAYGFRGWSERKPHFLESVPAGVDNLREILSQESMQREYPYLSQIAVELEARYGSATEAATTDPLRHRIRAEENPLTVDVTSFSYKKGLPQDTSGNGGGFMFDCRGPHNPGRYEPFKHLTGLDEPVRKFLEEDGEILPFIKECEALVDSSVERYLQRGFSHLSVNFGCTGGQHRSVYAADSMARHLNDKYGVKVNLLHREQNIAQEYPAKDVDVLFDSFLRAPMKKFNPDKFSQ